MWSLMFNFALIVVITRYHLVVGLSCYQCNGNGGADEGECESPTATGVLRKCPANRDAVCIFKNINGVTTRSCGVANYGPSCDMEGTESKCMCQWDECNEEMCACDNGRPVKAGSINCEGPSCDVDAEEDMETTPNPKSSRGNIAIGKSPIVLLSLAILAYQVTQ